MAETQLAAKVQQMLNEEKWTRTTLANYTTNSLKELDSLIEEAETTGGNEELVALCEEHFSHTKTSVIALYIAGIAGLRKQPADESYFIQLLDLFAEGKRSNLSSLSA